MDLIKERCVPCGGNLYIDALIGGYTCLSCGRSIYLNKKTTDIENMDIISNCYISLSSIENRGRQVPQRPGIL